MLDVWLAPDYRYFKLRDTDGDTYLVRHDERSNTWELTMFRATGWRMMAGKSVPVLLQRQVDRWAETWLKSKFSRLLELRAQDPGLFNYPIAVFSEWRGKAFYLNVRYRARSRRPEDDFVVRHTRITLTGFGRFELAYFRHTGKWVTVFRGLTAAECFREIEGNEVFWPTT